MSAAALQVGDGRASSRRVQPAVAQVGKSGWGGGGPRVVGSLVASAHSRAAHKCAGKAWPCRLGTRDVLTREGSRKPQESQTLFSPELWKELRKVPDYPHPSSNEEAG